MPGITLNLKRVNTLLKGARYDEIKRLTQQAAPESLLALWKGLKPFPKLLFFKLLEPGRAMEFYVGLPFKEKYFLFSAFPLAAIAPVLEPLPAAKRRFFVTLPRNCYDRMLDGLLVHVYKER